MHCFPLILSYLIIPSFGFVFHSIGWKSTRVTLRNNALKSVHEEEIKEALGVFIDQSVPEQSFIQCNIISCTSINGTEYGIGYPIDMPVMLTYFENNQLLPVKPDYPNYDHLINHVTTQLDGNDLELLQTPMVLTLQGEFEDDDFNNINPFYITNTYNGHSSTIATSVPTTAETEDEEEEESTIEEILQNDKFIPISIDNHETEYETENENNTGIESVDYTIHKVPHPTTTATTNTTILSDIPMEAIVTVEDTEQLQKSHQFAEHIIKYAKDIKLIGSFHYAKSNYHLVRLLEVSNVYVY